MYLAGEETSVSNDSLEKCYRSWRRRRLIEKLHLKAAGFLKNSLKPYKTFFLMITSDMQYIYPQLWNLQIKWMELKFLLGPGCAAALPYESLFRWRKPQHCMPDAWIMLTPKRQEQDLSSMHADVCKSENTCVSVSQNTIQTLFTASCIIFHRWKIHIHLISKQETRI